MENFYKFGNQTTVLQITYRSQKKSEEKLENILKLNKNAKHKNLWDAAEQYLQKKRFKCLNINRNSS